jgi:hypothetical protein
VRRWLVASVRERNVAFDRLCTNRAVRRDGRTEEAKSLAVILANVQGRIHYDTNDMYDLRHNLSST